MEGHDKKDNIAFLKNEYGTGGSSHALPGSDRAHEDHDANEQIDTTLRYAMVNQNNVKLSHRKYIS